MNSAATQNEARFASAASGIEPEPARVSEFIGRLVIGASLAALLYALWSSRLDSAVSWTAKELRVLPRMSVFVLAALMAMIIQGGRPRQSLLLGTGLLALAGAVLLLPLSQVWSYPTPVDQFSLMAKGSADAAVALAANADSFVAGTVMQVMRMELSLLAALLLGTWLGRDIRSSFHFLTLLCLASVGDIWMSLFRVPEMAGATQVLSLMRLPWPVQAGQLAQSPAFTDVLVLTAVIEAARTLRFHMLSLVLGAVAGYCAGSFLALEPWPAWPMLSMLMLGSGVLVGCWPDLKCKVNDVAWALVISVLLMVTLVAFSALHRKLHPRPEPRPDAARYYHAT